MEGGGRGEEGGGRREEGGGRREPGGGGGVKRDPEGEEGSKGTPFWFQNGGPKSAKGGVPRAPSQIAQEKKGFPKWLWLEFRSLLGPGTQIGWILGVPFGSLLGPHRVPGETPRRAPKHPLWGPPFRRFGELQMSPELIFTGVLTLLGTSRFGPIWHNFGILLGPF